MEIGRGFQRERESAGVEGTKVGREFGKECIYRGTHTKAHMYNQHTRGMATTRHRSLVERGGRKALLETLHTHTQKKQKKNVRKKPIFTNLKKIFEHIKLPANLLDYFLRSNKSNINQGS